MLVTRTITLLASAALFGAATPAAAGSLDFWESSLGAQDTTANFPIGPAQVASIVYDADSAEGGGLLFGASEIEIRPAGSAVFTAFSCAFHPCSQNNDYTFTTGGSGTGLLRVTDSYADEQHGVRPLGTITFDGPQQPGSMPLVTCNYTGLDLQERTCNPFVLVSLPEPGAIAPLAALALLFGPLARRRASAAHASR